MCITIGQRGDRKKMKTALVIMAAGIGSRFGEGIKQLAPVGINGEIIMDYSIHDAIEAGFNKIVFVIRKEIEKEFHEVIGNRIEKVCEKHDVEVAYAFQDLQDVPTGVSVPEGRKKPWGTGQAVLAARKVVKEPFVVINADDYYGKESFVKCYEFLKDNEANELCMAGFILNNTLSDNGGVTRGICKVDENDYLTMINETKEVMRTEDGIVSLGNKIDPEEIVSMNMWGFTADFMQQLEKGFEEFFRNLDGDELKEEYLIPIYVGRLLKEGKISVKVLKTYDSWFGVTYKEDKEDVVRSFKELIEKGVYSRDLFSDLA